MAGEQVVSLLLGVTVSSECDLGKNGSNERSMFKDRPSSIRIRIFGPQDRPRITVEKGRCRVAIGVEIPH